MPALSDQYLAEPAEELDGKLFAIDPDWYLGADGIMSVPISKNRIFWKFGDTLLGKLKDGKRVIEHMPRNTIAIQDTSDGLPGKVDWYWNSENGKASSFFRIHDDVSQLWFWPGTTFMFKDILFLLGYGIVPADYEIESMSFDIKQPWMVMIENPHEHPHRWRMKDRALKQNHAGRFYCSSHYFQNDYMYLTGFHCPEPGMFSAMNTILGRVKADTLFDDDWELNIESKNASNEWVKDPADAKTIFHPAVTEASLYYDKPRDRYLATTYIPSSPDMLISQAKSLDGDWTEPVSIYTDPQHAADDTLFSYTLRMHPHLSKSEDEIILSYAVNSSGLETIIPRPELYYPRFLRLDLRQLPTP